MQLELFEDDDCTGMGTPATYSHLSKVYRAQGFDMRNAPIRIAIIRSLHATDARNLENANNELFYYAARLIAGDYGFI